MVRTWGKTALRAHQYSLSIYGSHSIGAQGLQQDRQGIGCVRLVELPPAAASNSPPDGDGAARSTGRRSQSQLAPEQRRTPTGGAAAAATSASTPDGDGAAPQHGLQVAELDYLAALQIWILRDCCKSGFLGIALRYTSTLGPCCESGFLGSIVSLDSWAGLYARTYLCTCMPRTWGTTLRGMTGDGRNFAS